MITKPIYIVTKLVFLQLYPAYMCFKAIKIEQQPLTPLIMYWMVTTFYLVLEYITDLFFFWFPFYYELKLLIVLWLILPHTNGTEVLYTRSIQPFLAAHETIIDQTILDSQAHIKSRVVSYGQTIVRFLRTFVSDSVFKSFAAAEPPPPPPTQWNPYGMFAAFMTTPVTPQEDASSDTSMERVDSSESLGSLDKEDPTWSGYLASWVWKKKQD